MAPPAVHSKPFARASLLLIGLAWTLPFLQPYHRFPLTGFYSEWLAFALGLTAALLLLRKEPSHNATVPVIAIAPLGLILVIGLQVALGLVIYPEQALTATLYLLWTTLMVLLGHALKREVGLVSVAAALAWCVLLGGFLSALVGLIQHYQYSTPFDFLVARKVNPTLYGNLGQSNHYGSYVTLALASAAFLYARGRLHCVIAALCAALFLPVLALSGSRSVWLYLGALVILVFLMYRQLDEKEGKRVLAYMLCVIPGFVFAQWIVTMPFFVPSEGSAITSAQRLFQVSDGLGEKLQHVREAWWMFAQSPLLGAGFGQYAWHHFQYQATTGESALPGVFNHAHNIVLQLLAETGILGAGVVVGAIALWLVDLKRVKFDLEWWWLLALLLVIGIHSMLEYPLWYSYFLGVAAVLLGLGAERAWALRRTGTVRAVVGLAIVVGWVNLVAVISPYREFERLVFIPQSRHSPQPSEKDFEQAIVEIHREPLLTPYVELAVAYGVTVSEERLREKLELTARAMRFAPTSVVVYRYALLLALAGERSAAMLQLEWAMRAYPEDIADIVAELTALAQRRPDAFAPLLELAAARLRK